MNYTITELIFFFLFYSFAGWMLETIYAAVSKKKFLNRGFLNGVVCPSYGTAIVIILVLFEPTKEGILFTFVVSTVVATMVEYVTAAFTEQILKKKYWDYSQYKFNIAGRVCGQYSLLWGILGTVTVVLIQPLLTMLIRSIDYTIVIILIWIVFAIVVLDFIVTIGAVRHGKDQSVELQLVRNRLRSNSAKLSQIISTYVENRLEKAYPEMKSQDEDSDEGKDIFAYGCGFHKLLWLFMIGAFAGDIVETIFCFIKSGEIMSRSSVIYGPFSIVWGLGIVLFTPILYRFKDMNDRHVFVAGTVLGGVYEYGCSVFTEIFFGTVFWDYSEIPFNLGGRINLLYCFFWGIAALVWVKHMYPVLSSWIERVPKKVGKAISAIIVIFMTFNLLVSAAALARYDERANKIPANNEIRVFLDEHYGDDRIEKVYPNAIHR